MGQDGVRYRQKTEQGNAFGGIHRLGRSCGTAASGGGGSTSGGTPPPPPAGSTPAIAERSFPGIICCMPRVLGLALTHRAYEERHWSSYDEGCSAYKGHFWSA